MALFQKKKQDAGWEQKGDGVMLEQNIETVDVSKEEEKVEMKSTTNTDDSKNVGEEKIETECDKEEKSVKKEDSEVEKAKSGDFTYIYLAFEGDQVYLNKDGKCLYSAMTKKEAKELVMSDWGGNELPDYVKKRVRAKNEVRVEVDMSLVDKKERRNKAREELYSMFKEIIDEAKTKKATDSSNMAEKPSLNPQGDKTENKPIVADQHNPKLEPDTEGTGKKVKYPDDSVLLQTISTTQTRTTDEIIVLNQNVTDSTNDIIEALSKEITDFCYSTSRQIDDSKREAFKELGMAFQSVKRETDNISGKLQEATTTSRKNQEEILAKTKSIQKKLDKIDEVCEATEMMEGRLQKLDHLEQIASILSDKGIEISRDFPPTCVEEEDIINLVRYSKKISEQLGYAARELIRKKAVYENRDQNLANEQAITEKKIADAHIAGIEEGKLMVVQALLAKYADVDTIIGSDNDHVHVIWSLLQELGVEVDGDGYYKKGVILDLKETDVVKMAAQYKQIDEPGKYRVVKTGLVYTGQVVFKAEFEMVTNEETHLELEKSEASEEMKQDLNYSEEPQTVNELNANRMNMDPVYETTGNSSVTSYSKNE